MFKQRSKLFPLFLILIVILVITAAPVMAQEASPPDEAVSNFVLSPEIIVSITSVLLTLVFSYFPKLRTKFAGMEPETKSAVMLLLMAFIVAAVVALNCYGWINAGVSCDQIGLQQVVWYYILAIVANQGVYNISPKTTDVTLAKRVRDLNA